MGRRSDPCRADHKSRYQAGFLFGIKRFWSVKQNCFTGDPDCFTWNILFTQICFTNPVLNVSRETPYLKNGLKPQFSVYNVSRETFFSKVWNKFVSQTLAKCFTWNIGHEISWPTNYQWTRRPIMAGQTLNSAILVRWDKWPEPDVSRETSLNSCYSSQNL
jgi:hypothetical protein